MLENKNGMHLNIPSTECWTGRFVGPQAVLTKLFKAWYIIVVLMPVFDILIPSQTRHSPAPNLHALD